MQLLNACSDILAQLTHLVDSIHEEDFRKPSPVLSGSTIGQHLRHTLEFFICLEDGYAAGTINYDKRNHDKRIENDKYLAGIILQQISQFVSQMDLDRPLSLELNYNLESEESIALQTNASRELVYNIEHAVHHMALIKIGIREIAPYIKLDNGFGVAASTIRHQEARKTVRTTG